MFRESRAKLSGTILLAMSLAGCATAPGSIGETTVTKSPTSNLKAEAVPGKIVVKMKASGRSISGFRSVQAIEGLSNTHVYSVPSGSTVEEAIAKLRQDPSVEYAEPNYIYHAIQDHVSSTVNDPMFNQLWGIQKIQAPTAWDTTTGDPNILVAVVDTGVDYNHPDLVGQVIKGPNLVSKTNDPMDDQGHGSHVAGTIAAIGDNGVGVVGVAYKTKILAVKVLGSDGSGDTATIAQGILKASELGAKVINLSLGGPSDSSVLRDAVNQATSKGVLVVVAAGNDGKTTPNYPAAYPNVLSVGATDQSDKRTSFSNYASSVGIAAPGLNILSSTDGNYKQESGTSMASPHVAGAAALLLAKNASLTPAQLKSQLISNGDAVTGFNSNVKRLNIARALSALTGGPAPAPAPTPVPAPTPDPVQTPAPELPGVPGAPQLPGGPVIGPAPIPGNPGMYPPGYYPTPGQRPGQRPPRHRFPWQPPFFPVR